MPYKDEKHPNRQRISMRHKLKKRYGLALETYEHMHAIQQGVCAICKQPEKDSYKQRLSVDHDHSSGKIRGLLCHMCNTALGKLSDCAERCESAARYLRAHRSNS